MLVNYKTINEYVREAVLVLTECYPSFEYQGFYQIKIGRSRSAWGTVYREQRGYRLTISNVFNEITDKKKAYNKLMSTLIHELIHTIPGCWNHGAKFKAVAALINARYPEYYVCRATSMRSYGVVKQRKEYSWIVYCETCSKVYKYRKAPKYRDCIRLCNCGVCRSNRLICLPINDFRRISNIAV